MTTLAYLVHLIVYELLILIPVFLVVGPLTQLPETLFKGPLGFVLNPVAFVLVPLALVCILGGSWLAHNAARQRVFENAGFFESFRIAGDILRQGVQGISDIITIPGIINRDFADVKAIMQGMGYAVMGTASANGTRRATEAAQKAIASPLLEAGAIVLPAIPSFYSTPKNVNDVADTVVWRILDQLGLPNQQAFRWQNEQAGRLKI